MKNIRRILSFYVGSSLHVAISVVALTLITLFEFDLPMNTKLLIFIFFGSLTGYNFIKFVSPIIEKKQLPTVEKRNTFIFLILSFIGFSIAAVRIKWQILLATLGFGLFTFFYAVPLIQQKNLRAMSGLKIFIVAFVWAGVTVLLPVLANKNELHADAWMTFVQRILVVIVLMIPFELRDIDVDDFQLRTVPQQIGIRNTKILGELLMVLILICEAFKSVGETAYFVSLTIFIFILAVVILISKTQQTKYFSSFFVEGLPILWLLMYVFLK